MSSEEFTVTTVKCGGCASAIESGLRELSGVESVEVAIDSGRVVVSGSGLDRAQLSDKLAQLGYPEA
jgi:copper chaperone CopZ